MKFIGTVFLVFASFFLGHARRGAKIKGEKIMSAFSSFFGEIADSIEYRSRSMGEILDTLSVTEKYADLDFLPLSCRFRDQGLNLQQAICKGFSQSDCIQSMSMQEKAEAMDMIQSLGCETDALAISRLRCAGEQFHSFAQNRHESNKQQNGYYETMYTLIGAAIAIVLL